MKKLLLVKRISFIFLCLLILGCQKEKTITEICLGQPTVIKEYPVDNPGAWKIICAKSPYIENMEIPEDVIMALPKVFNQNCGFPKAKDVNDICENEY